MGSGGGHHQLQGLFDDVGEGYGLYLEREVARLDARRIQQVVDYLRETQRLAADDAQPLLLRDSVDLPDLEELREPQESGH